MPTAETDQLQNSEWCEDIVQWSQKYLDTVQPGKSWLMNPGSLLPLDMLFIGSTTVMICILHYIVV